MPRDIRSPFVVDWNKVGKRTQYGHEVILCLRGKTKQTSQDLYTSMTAFACSTASVRTASLRQ